MFRTQQVHETFSHASDVCLMCASHSNLLFHSSVGLNGLNGLNFLMPAGHTHGGMSAVAVPYFLVPSPLIAGTVPTSRAEGAAGSSMSFSMPTVLSPARFVMAGGAFSMSDKVNNAEHHGYRGPGSTLSPQGLRKESPRLVQMQVSAI